MRRLVTDSGLPVARCYECPLYCDEQGSSYCRVAHFFPVAEWDSGAPGDGRPAWCPLPVTIEPAEAAEAADAAMEIDDE